LLFIIISSGRQSTVFFDFQYFSPVSHPDSLDWKDISTEQIVERVTRNVKNGSIILFHNNAQHVLEYLPLVLSSLQEDGYEIVKIDDLIYHENYHIDSQGCQINDGAEQNRKMQ